MESKNITDTYIYHRLGRRRAVPTVAQMPYRDSAGAGETGTNEERGEAESTRESKAVISSLNSMELSKNRFRRWETVPFAAHGVPEMPFGDGGRDLLSL